MKKVKNAIKFQKKLIEKAIKYTGLYRFFQIPVESKKVEFWYDQKDVSTINEDNAVTISEADLLVTKQASDENDFYYLYNRELYKNGIQDTAAKHLLFKKELREEIKNLIKAFKSNPNVQKYPLIDIADSFLRFVDAYPTPIVDIRGEISHSKEIDKSVTLNIFPHSKVSLPTNNFNDVLSETNYKYFHDALVLKSYLSNEDLLLFLKDAFENCLPPPHKYTLQNVKLKQDIIHIFYLYYTNKAGKPHGKQPKYAALLGEYFQGFKTKNVLTNFSK